MCFEPSTVSFFLGPLVQANYRNEGELAKAHSDRNSREMQKPMQSQDISGLETVISTLWGKQNSLLVVVGETFIMWESKTMKFAHFKGICCF